MKLRSILRVAYQTKTLDGTWVESLRKDLLTLLKNLPRVKTYKDAHRLKEAFKTFKNRFNELFFEQFLNRDLKEMEGIPESDLRYIDKKLRGDAWTLASDLSLPIGFADTYYSEDARFAAFEKESPAWKAKVQRRAQAFWKSMKEVIEYFEGAYRKPIKVRVQEEEKVTLEGFKLVFKGFEAGNETHEESLTLLKEGLKLYRQRASRVAPLLLAKQLPIECEFKSTLDKGGEYHSAGYITLYTSSFASRGYKWVTHALAHEMGHHLFRNLSADTRDFWQKTISGDLGDLSVVEVLRKWPEGAWAFDMVKYLGDTDPVFALQVDAVSHDSAYGNPQTKEDFQKLLDSGVRTIRVPQHPVTGYGNKNPEEAFCEALALLVAYGPQAVHEKVRWWLEVALPGQVRLASTNAINGDFFSLGWNKSKWFMEE